MTRGYIDDHGIAALCVAILKNLLPEQAFLKLEGWPYKYILTDQDTEDMIKMRKRTKEYPNGMYYHQIAKIYDIDPGTVHKRIKRYKQKNHVA